jgi:excisionase family DNA binding protein
MQHSNGSSTAPTGTAQATALLKFADVRDMLAVSRSGLYKMLRERRIPYKRIGIEYRFDRLELQAWLDKRSVKSRV